MSDCIYLLGSEQVQLAEINMRRLDFGIVAQAMNDAKPRGKADDSRYIVQRDQWVMDCVNLADAFEKQTLTFERARFLKNCGVNVPLPGAKIL